MATAVMFFLLFLFLILGVPIGICLIFPLFFLIRLDPVTTGPYLANVMYSGVASFTTMAIPFFVLAGDIMSGGGISERLVSFADRCVGKVTGSYGMVTVLGCMFFGAVSGSSPATCAAIGSIMIPVMVRKGYNKYYAVALVACAGGLGIIVPPSYPMLIYGVTNNISVGDLFMAGIGPACVVGGVLMLVNYLYCRKHNLRGDIPFNFKEFLRAFWDAKLAILMPVIILGGIYGGIFTPTESAVVAVVYGLIVSFFIYRSLTLKRALEMFRKAAILVGGTLLTIAPANGLGKVFAFMGVTDTIQKAFYSVSTNKYIILIMIYALMFVVGMFVQTTPAIVILSPMLLQVVQGVGIDPIHFGMVMIICLAIAFVTPPVATNLFMTSSLTGVPIDRIVRASIPFLIGLIISLFIVGFVPAISLFLLH